MRSIIFVLFLFPLILFAESSKSVKFHQGSLTSAKEKAMNEGKLYFVDFVANYCYMCKMMDETTFRDERVVDYMEKNYVPVKINVDDFDGFVWKQKYQIKVLPTIMIFNSKGEIVARHEESLGGTRLLSILETHNRSYNKIVIPVTPSTPTSPVYEESTTSSQGNTATPPTNSNTTTSTTTNSPIYSESPPTSTTSSENHTTSNLPPTSSNAEEVIIPTNENHTTPAVNAGEGLFEFSVKRHPSIGFGIQVGVFQDYANVLQEVAKLENLYTESVLVHITKLNNKLAYRVIIGNFNSKYIAENYHNNILKAKGTNGFIKDLASLQ